MEGAELAGKILSTWLTLVLCLILLPSVFGVSLGISEVYMKILVKTLEVSAGGMRRPNTFEGFRERDPGAVVAASRSAESRVDARGPSWKVSGSEGCAFQITSRTSAETASWLLPQSGGIRAVTTGPPCCSPSWLQNHPHPLFYYCYYYYY